jgi:hypothetical protein
VHTGEDLQKRVTKLENRSIGIALKLQGMTMTPGRGVELLRRIEIGNIAAKSRDDILTA